MGYDIRLIHKNNRKLDWLNKKLDGKNKLVANTKLFHIIQQTEKNENWGNATQNKWDQCYTQKKR